MFSWRAFPASGGDGPGAYLAVPALERDGIRVAFTMRAGGRSRAPFESLNLSFLSGDEPENVRANRARVLQSIGARLDAWTSARQVHGAHAERVRSDHRGRGAVSPETTIPDTDALWTDEPGIALAVLTADCVPIVLADTARRRVAVVHAGWRGLVAGVIGSAAGELGGELRAFVGPSIGPCCYEVGAEVSQAAETALGPGVVSRAGIGEHLDLWRGVRAALAQANVRDVAVAALCTRCEPHRFFSHRAGHTARQGVVAMLA